jgi:hypothetical protein
MNSVLFKKIEESTSHKKSRVSLANFCLKTKENIVELVEIAFNLKHQHHVKAFWVLELVCEKKLKLFIPFFNSFCFVLPNITNDSSIRPSAKICMFLAKSNHRKNGISLTKEQEHIIIEVSLDRLIGTEKVAAKYYAIKALFVLGKKYPWVHDTLKQILIDDAADHSPAYQAAARHVLKQI